MVAKSQVSVQSCVTQSKDLLSSSLPVRLDEIRFASSPVVQCFIDYLEPTWLLTLHSGHLGYRYTQLLSVVHVHVGS